MTVSIFAHNITDSAKR